MLPYLRKDIKRVSPHPPSRTGRGGFRPAIPSPQAGNSQLAVAEATSTDTPGPMVELIETFFM